MIEMDDDAGRANGHGWGKSLLAAVAWAIWADHSGFWGVGLTEKECALSALEALLEALPDNGDRLIR